MKTAYLVVTGFFALITGLSAILKVRHDPKVVKVVHETVGVPMHYLPVLALCELAGVAGLTLGIWWRPLGVAAAAGLVVYFLGAVVSHLRVGDISGIGAALSMLAFAAAALALGWVTT